MLNKCHTKRPTKHHVKCKTKDCPNYYHVLHTNHNNKCKPCRRNDK